MAERSRVSRKNRLHVRECADRYRAVSKTPNAQRPTLNAQWQRDASTSQKETPNAQWQKGAYFDLEERLLEFSARIIGIVDTLPNTRAANHIAGQLLRCGTSPYGNHGEVEAAESRRIFVHKLRICLKELRETRRWLQLVRRASLLPQTQTELVLRETEELIKIFFASIRTAEKNAK